jgi:hypothetical protein
VVRFTGSDLDLGRRLQSRAAFLISGKKTHGIRFFFGGIQRKALSFEMPEPEMLWHRAWFRGPFGRSYVEFKCLTAVIYKI